MNITLLDIWIWTGPLLVAGGLSYLLRKRGWLAQFLLWLFGLPALYVIVAVLTMIVSFQVFGVDLID